MQSFARAAPMKIDGQAWRTIWLEEGGRSVGVIDQTLLPHRFTTRSLSSCDEAAEAIRTMVVRGAPLIGVTGAYGLMLARGSQRCRPGGRLSNSMPRAPRP